MEANNGNTIPDEFLVAGVRISHKDVIESGQIVLSGHVQSLLEKLSRPDDGAQPNLEPKTF